MAGRHTAVTALFGVLVLGSLTALVLVDGEGVNPTTTTIGTLILGTTGETVVGAPVPDPGRVATSGTGCVPDPGKQVVASGPIQGFPPGEDVNGLTVVGSTARVDFRSDAPGNRNLVLFRLVYLDGDDVHGWTEVGANEDVELGFAPDTGGLSGWFGLSHTVNPTGPATDNPERADFDLVYNPGAGTLSGTVTHPEATFRLDLTAEILARDYFADPSCYPAVEDNPVGSTPVAGG